MRPSAPGTEYRLVVRRDTVRPQHERHDHRLSWRTATLGGLALDATRSTPAAWIRDDVPVHVRRAASARVDELETALVAARGGDEAGFAILWRDLHPRLLRYLRVRGDEGPEDLAAETWMHVVRGLPTFEGGLSEFRAWLFTIARHRAIDQGRSRSRGLTVLAVADPAEVADRMPTAPSAEQDAADNEERPRRCGWWRRCRRRRPRW